MHVNKKFLDEAAKQDGGIQFTGAHEGDHHIKQPW